MKPIAILIYSFVLFLSFFFIYWFLFLSPFNVPDLIPNTKIHLDGILIFFVTLPILIFALKNYLKINPSASIINLVLSAALITFVAKTSEQIIRVFIFNDVTIFQSISIIARSVILCTIISFFIAFQLKTKRTKWLLAFIVLFIAIYDTINYFYPLS